MTSVDERAHHHNGSSGRVPPYDLAAEQAVLGACMLSTAAVDACADEHVEPADFYREPHRYLWSAIVALHDAGQPTDPIALTAWLDRNGLLDAVGGGSEITSIQGRTPATSSAGHYARVVHGHAISRRIIAAAGEIAELGYSRPDDPHAALEHAEQILADIGAGDAAGDTARALRDGLDDYLTLLEARVDGTIPDGAPTGLADLDALIGGLRPGQLVTIAGRPGMGKTAVGLTVAANAARCGHPSMFTSIEMGETELYDRLVAAHSRTDQTALRTGRVASNDWTRIGAAVGRLAEVPLTIHDSPAATIARIRSRARRIPNLAVVVVDYLQIVDPGTKSESRRVDVDELARGLKRLARAEHVTVIALAQLNRGVEQRADKRPLLSDLRESGQIEQESDVVIGLYRDEVYHPDTREGGVLEAIVLKQRQGRVGTAKLGYLTATQQIVDLTGDVEKERGR